MPRNRQSQSTQTTALEPTKASSRRHLALLTIGAAAIVAASYWPVLSAQALSFDDQEYVVNNPLVGRPGWASASRFVSEVLAPSTVGGYYQPLTMISLMMDVARGGRPDDLIAFHQTSLLLHVVNTCLIILLLAMLFDQPWPAALAGLLYGLHPAMVDSVVWVAERKTLLATFFAVLSMVAYVRYARTGRLSAYALAILLFIPSLLSKPTTMPLPFLLLILDAWPLGRLGGRAVLEKLPFLVAAVASAVISYISQKATCGVFTSADRSWFTPLLIVSHNLVLYLHQLIWPVRLCTHVPFPRPFIASQPMVLAGLIGAALLIIIAMVSLKRTRAVAAGLLFFVLALLPTMGVVGVTFAIASNRYLYFPVLGLLLMVTAGLTRLWPGRARTILFLAMIACVLEVAVARTYLSRWRNTEGLARYMLMIEPDCAAMHAQLGYALTQQGRGPEAAEAYSKAVVLDPTFADARYSLATLLAGQNRAPEAISLYEQALSLRPRWAEAHNNLGISLAMQGRSDEAAGHFAEALSIKPMYAEAHNNLGLVLAEQNRLDDAISHYQQAIAANPAYVPAHFNLGDALVGSRRFEQAIAQYEQVLKLDPSYIPAHKRLGILCEQQGRKLDAISHYRRALQLNPQDAALAEHVAKLQGL